MKLSIRSDSRLRRWDTELGVGLHEVLDVVDFQICDVLDEELAVQTAIENDQVLDDVVPVGFGLRLLHLAYDGGEADLGACFRVFAGQGE